MPGLAHKYETFRTIARSQGVPGVLRALEWNYLPRIIPRYGTMRDWALTAGSGPEALAARRAHGAPDLLLAYFGGIGDELLLTVVVHELRRRGFTNNWIITEFPDVWRDNAEPALVLPWGRRHVPWAEFFGWNFVRPHYTKYMRRGDRDMSPRKHVLTLMCEAVGIVGPVAHKPRLALTDDERAAGARRPNQIAIQSSGLVARFAMMTKQWFPERYQAVVDALKGDFNFVQIGSPKDPPLDGVLDLRGKTSLRETAAVLAQSLAFVGQVGMPMHLARAVDCRAVIIYGGREHPAQTGYSCNENLYSPVPCSPCWKSNSCGHAMACMQQITPADVVRAVVRQVALRGEPLAVDVDVASVPGSVPARTTDDGRTFLTLTDIYGDRREIEAKPLGPGDLAATPPTDVVRPAAYRARGAAPAVV